MSTPRLEEPALIRKLEPCRSVASLPEGHNNWYMGAWPLS